VPGAGGCGDRVVGVGIVRGNCRVLVDPGHGDGADSRRCGEPGACCGFEAGAPGGGHRCTPARRGAEYRDLHDSPADARWHDLVAVGLVPFTVGETAVRRAGRLSLSASYCRPPPLGLRPALGASCAPMKSKRGRRARRSSSSRIPTGRDAVRRRATAIVLRCECQRAAAARSSESPPSASRGHHD